jgi:pimeloyl-ACP methyl ester carboxylesterase
MPPAGFRSGRNRRRGATGVRYARPTLYVHGTQDGCHTVSQDQVGRVPQHCGPGSHSQLIDGVGHFLSVQRPTEVTKLVLEFLAA